MYGVVYYVVYNDCVLFVVQAMDIVGTILEGYPKSKKEFFVSEMTGVPIILVAIVIVVTFTVGRSWTRN